MKKNNSGFSIIIAIFIVLIMGLATYSIIAYIVPFSTSTKGIENSSVAYYVANEGIEKGLYLFKKNESTDPGNSHTKSSTSTVDLGYKVTAQSTTIPETGKGNSEYDKDFNIIGANRPLEIIINKDNINWDKFEITFKVPDLDGNGTNNESLNDAPSDVNILSWSLSGNGQSLSSTESITNSLIKASEVNSSSISNMNLSSKVGIKSSDGTNQDLSTFYGDIKDFCDSGDFCKLKISVIGNLETDSGGVIAPYLEYKITYSSDLPTPVINIDTEGKAYGFKKEINAKLERETTNQAFDFTIFQ